MRRQLPEVLIHPDGFGEYDVYLDGEKLRKLGRPREEYSRAVYLSDKFIVKIDDGRWGDGEDQVEREEKFLDKVRPDDRRYFVPNLVSVVNDSDCNCSYSVQELIPFAEKNSPAEKAALPLVKKVAERYEMTDVILDYMTKNWGVDSRTMQPVIYDYAY